MATALVLALLLAAATGCGDAGPRRNLLVISLDTTRADHLSCYGYPALITPYLDGLAASGVLFERAYAPMPQTLPSHATLFTGLEPRQHGALENALVLGPDAVTLAEIATAQGYETAGVIASRVLQRGTGIEQGYASYDEPRSPERPAEHVTDAALEWVSERQEPERPYLLWVHYFDPHGPLKPRPHTITQRDVLEEMSRYREFDDPQLVPKARILATRLGYANEVVEMDRQVGRLLSELRERGMLEDTVIVVVGDHGEGLLEHDEIGHGVSVFEELMRVPLIVVAPGLEPGLRVSEPVHVQDLFGTILDLTGLPAPPGGPVGDDQRLPLEGSARPRAPRALFVERPHYTREGERNDRGLRHGWGYGTLVGVVLGDWKLIRYPDGSTELFDLAADPEELTDVKADHPDIAEDLGRRLDAWLALHPVDDALFDTELSDERRADLEALGYLR